MRHEKKKLQRISIGRELRKASRRRQDIALRCPNCNEDIEDGGHFVPPSVGDKGFFTCQPEGK